MNPIRFLLSGAVLAANLFFLSQACAEEPCLAPGGAQDSLQALTDTSTQASHFTLGPLYIRMGIGPMVFGGEDTDLHLAFGAIITVGLPSWKRLSLSMDYEVWVTASLGSDDSITTLPILLGLRGEIFPTSPLRLYGSLGAGLCIFTITSVSDWEIVIPWVPIPTREITEDINVLFAYAPGGGLELQIDYNRLLSIDYRYIVVGLGSIRGGHVLCVSIGLRF